MKKIKLFEEYFNDSKLKIAVYHDTGITEDTFEVWKDFFQTYLNTNIVELNQDNFNLQGIDLLVIPGGDSFRTRLGMAQNSTVELKQWVKNGGKLLAVCAGFHLIASGHDWALKMINVKGSNANLPKPAYQPVLRVTSDAVDIEFEITELGKEIFSTQKDSVVLHYHGGPIAEPLSDDIQVILKIKEGIPMQVPGDNYTVNKIAGVFANYGKGNIIALSPHFEKTKGQEYMLANAINFLLK